MARTTKLLLNDVDSCVEEMLEGIVNGNPGQQLVEGHRVVIRDDVKTVREKGQVTIICGGGSGHEPFAAGFVGKGMLTAAVPGSVFASPPPSDILAAIKGVQSSAGTLVIVANYTGDRLNFGIAVERAKAMGMKVAMVVVGEDCALQTSDKTAGRRGLVGIVSIMKVAGAMAELGRTLEEIVEVTTEATKSMGTIGLSLTACSVPGTGPSFQLGSDEMELGLGAHGEAGVRRMKLLPADATIEVMINHMISESNASRLALSTGERVAVTMNNLGGMSELEMHVLTRHTIKYLEAKGVKVTRFYFGHFMTSLDMSGFNINVMKLNDKLTSYLDAPTCAPGWGNFQAIDRKNKPKFALNEEQGLAAAKSDSSRTVDEMYGSVKTALVRACHALVANEHHLNELDTAAGDGDCGTTLKRGANHLLSHLSMSQTGSIQELLQVVATTAEDSMGGASGGIYSLLFTAASHRLSDPASVESWCAALQAGMAAVSRYGGAEPGDRTMLDSLDAVHRSLCESVKSGTNVKKALDDAAKAAQAAADSTATMKARAGRASYVAANQLTKPDAGAAGVAVWMKSLAST